MPRIYPQLTCEQVGHFLERGFVTVQGVFDAAAAQHWLDDAWIRFGYDRHDPGGWTEKSIRLSARSHVDAHTFAPAAWRAAMELAGAEKRVVMPWRWGNSFIANLGVGRRPAVAAGVTDGRRVA
jgi:hypothetical protein